MYKTISRDFELIEDYQIIRSEVIQQKEKIQNILTKNFSFEKWWDYIEHTSANPTGALQSANLIQSICGDLICRINNTTGYYYVNDIGLNYFTLFYLVKKSLGKKTIKTEYLSLQLIKSCYRTLEDHQAEEVKNIRALAHKSQELDQEQKTLLTYVLSIIRKQMAEVNVKPMNYIYESSYLKQTYELLEKIKLNQSHQGFLKSETGFFYQTKDKSIRLTTADGIALYNFTDYIYRMAVNKVYDRPMIILGPGNVAGSKLVEAITNKDWALVIVPSLNYKDQKISKRKQIDVDKQVLLSNVGAKDVQESNNLLRLWCCQIINDSKVDLEKLTTDSNINYFKKVLHTEERQYDLNKVFQSYELLNNEQKKLLLLWSQIEEIVLLINKKMDLNKIVKLLSRLYLLFSKARNLELINLHYKLLRLFLNELGFF